MTVTYLVDPAVKAAIERLIDLARSDTGQARRAANFLLAWWNGDDREIAADMATVFSFLGQHGGAVYADAFGYRDEMAELVERWRDA